MRQSLTSGVLASLTRGLWVAAVCAIATQAAADKPATSPAYEYLVIHQSARAFLTELSRHAGIRIDLSENVRGQLTHLHLSGSVDEILSRLATRMGWEMFTVNGVTFISDAEESRTRFVRLGDVGIDDARAALERSGLAFDNYPMSTAVDGTALILSGPPKLLALREAVIAAIPLPEPAAPPPAPQGQKVVVMRGGKAEAVIFREEK